MELNELPNDIMDSVFDIVKKEDKIYIIFKEDTMTSEEKVREALGGNNLEFTDLFEMVHNHLLRELSDTKSIFDNEPLMEKMGFDQTTEIFYDLTKLDQTRKVLFNYALLGRRGNNGILQNFGGRRLSKSVIALPSENERELENFIKKWNVKYSKRRVLLFEEE